MGPKLSKIKENFIFFSPKLPKTPPKKSQKEKIASGEAIFSSFVHSLTYDSWMRTARMKLENWQIRFLPSTGWVGNG